MKNKKLCGRCEKNQAEPLHSCPFQEDINNNTDEEYCDCCSVCRHECAMDI